jgi:predicted DCC family thiol-disulfide oxidoreductase YuxK
MNIVLFDGICNLCNSTVSFLIKYDTHQNLHFAAQQTESGKKIMKAYQLPENNSSVLFIKEGIVVDKSDAIIEIAKMLTGWPSLFKYAFIVPPFLRDGIYNYIAKNRYQMFGKKSTCAIPSAAQRNKFL